MTTLVFAWRYLWSRPMAAALNVLLLSLGLASITFLMLVGHQFNKAFDRDLAGIDVVVGAKGSPMQLILSGVFHINVPPGNVPLKAVRELEKPPVVDSVIPISLVDNLRGFRIVGTSHAYIHHYEATLAQGSLWGAQVMVDEREITMALIHYKTPMATMSFPRYINTSTEMQAAAPALEITRLLNMLGLGTDVLRAFAGVLLLTAGLSVFIALWNAVRERSGDLALLRLLGAPPGLGHAAVVRRLCGWGCWQPCWAY